MFAKHSLFTLCLAIITGVLWYNSREFVYPTTVYINTLLVILGLLTLVHAYKCFKEYGQSDDSPKLSSKAKIKLGISLVAALLYALLIPCVGFYTMSFLYFLGCVHFFNPDRSLRSFAIALASSLGGTVLVYLLFEIGLQVPTPSGFLI